LIIFLELQLVPAAHTLIICPHQSIGLYNHKLSQIQFHLHRHIFTSQIQHLKS